MRNLRRIFCIAMICMPILAHADDGAWDATISVGPKIVRAYDGSDKYRIYPFPIISAEYNNGDVFIDIEDGVGSYFIRGDNYKIGASVWGHLGRYNDSDKQNLAGVHDVHMGPTANILGQYRIGGLRLNAKITHGIDGYGTVAKFTAATFTRIATPLFFYGAIGPIIGDAQYMTTFYGISHRDATRTNYEYRHMHADIQSIEATVGTLLFFTENWHINTMLRVNQIVGHTTHSPLVKKTFDPTVMLTIGYHF